MTGLLGRGHLGRLLLGFAETVVTPPAPSVDGPIRVVNVAAHTSALTMADARPRVSGVRARIPSVTNWEQH